MTIIIEKATIKMKKLLKYILLLIYVALMPACGEDSGLDGVFANKPFALVTAADDGPDATPNRDGQLGSRGGLLRNLSPERNSGLVGLFPVSRETDRGSD